MPKKANRPGTRTKSRPVRRPQSPALAPALELDEPARVQTPAVPARAENAGRAVGAATTTPARRGVPGRRISTITTDYSYLRRDITLLAILAPVMIIVVVVAFLILH